MGDDRVQQFVDYISDLETRGNASVVPEFHPKLDWLNSAPLHLGKVLLKANTSQPQRPEEDEDEQSTD
ncbi:unnamed protein product [Rhodiola kirilowii]